MLLALSESVNVDHLYSTLMSACKAAAGDDAVGAHAESAAASGMSEMVTGESEKWQQGGSGVGTTSLGGATTVALPKFKLRLTVSYQWCPSSFRIRTVSLVFCSNVGVNGSTLYYKMLSKFCAIACMRSRYLNLKLDMDMDMNLNLN